MLFKPTIALLLAASTVSTAQAEGLSAKDSLLAQNVMSEVNLPSLEASIKQKVTDDIAKMDLAEKIKAEVQTKVDKIVAEQKRLQLKWDELHEFEKKQWDEYKEMTMKQKLATIYESVADKSQLGELWAGLTQDEVDKHMQNVRLNFDLKNQRIIAQSESVDVKGKPLFEWIVDPKSGQVQEIRRQPDASHERVVERTIDPAQLDSQAFKNSIDNDKKVGDELTQAMQESNKHAVLSDDDSSILQSEWDEAEAQRDIAFKIMYFFIAFILCTFSMLYAYFRMVQQSEIEARQARRAKGLMDDKNVPMTERESSFADFMTGQFDTNYIVNPYMRNIAQARVVNKKAQQQAAKARGNDEVNVSGFAKKALTIGAQSVSIGLGMGTATLLQHYNSQKKNQQSNDEERAGGKQSAFGTSDLDHLALENRGRFPGIDTEHFEFNAEQPTESLINKEMSTATPMSHINTNYQ